MDWTTYLRFAAALAFVLGLIGLFSWAMRRYGSLPRLTGAGGAQRRLAVIEAVAVDGKRRLVLVRRDDTEHLLLLGAAGEVVVERGIRTTPAGGELP